MANAPAGLVGNPDAPASLRWLTTLRWLACAGQLVAIVTSSTLLDWPMNRAGVGLALAFEVALSLGSTFWLARRWPVSTALVVLVLVLDVAALTALFAATGGPSNPFSILYLIHVALATVLVGSGGALVVMTVAAVAFGFLYAYNDSSGDVHAHHHHDHGPSMDAHLQGMWFAFVVTGAIIVFFFDRIHRHLRERDHLLVVERVRAEQVERLAGLATLAAGAAHELATPLATIALTASELERSMVDEGPTRDDLRLIRGQVARCRRILDHLIVQAGENPGEPPMPCDLTTLTAEIVGEHFAGTRVALTPATGGPGLVIGTLAPHAFRRAVVAVIENALRVSHETPVWVATVVDGARARVGLSVTDRGPGMTPEVLARAREPFFTTQPTGSGMGLGLYVADRALVDMGGTLELQSEPGAGTVVTLWVPEAAP